MRTVTVTGHGSASAVPDTAVVRLAAGHRAPDVAQALAGVDAAVSTLGTMARRFTDARRIATTELTVWPAYDDGGGPAGFEARHGLRVVVADLGVAAEMLTALAAEVGDAFRVDGVALEVADPGPATRDAREAALGDARERAEHLAGLADAALGAVVSIVEGGSGGVGYAAMAMAKETSFEPGERALGASVTVTYELTGPDT
ncbi:MAG: SIMPL domain-containing protein [Nocardioides sp.]